MKLPLLAGAAARYAAAGTYTAEEAWPVNTADELPDFTQLDDTALLAARAQMRAELRRLPPNSPGHAKLAAWHDASLDEIVQRAHQAWTRASQGHQWMI